MSASKIVGAVSMLTLLSGCATLPNVTATYYFPKAETLFTLTQTIGCTPLETGKHRLIRSVISVTSATTNSADTDWKVDGKVRKGRITYKDLNGTFVDGDATVTLTADGRLASINATSEGQGGAILKDIVTIAGTVGFAAAPPAGGPETSEDKACAQVDIFAGIGQADASKAAPMVTLTYSVAIRYVVDGSPGSPKFEVVAANSPENSTVSADGTIVLQPDPGSKPAYDALRGVLGDRMDTELSMAPTAATVDYLETTSATIDKKSELSIELPRIALLSLEIKGRVADMIAPTRIWSGSVAVPARATYELPFPKPALFGKTAFGLTLSDNGAIQTLHYGTTSGAPGVLDSANAIAAALQPKTNAQKAADYKDQADLIAQQQRLLACQLSKETCK